VEACELLPPDDFKTFQNRLDGLKYKTFVHKALDGTSVVDFAWIGGRTFGSTCAGQTFFAYKEPVAKVPSEPPLRSNGLMLEELECKTVDELHNLHAHVDDIDFCDVVSNFTTIFVRVQEWCEKMEFSKAASGLVNLELSMVYDRMVCKL